MKTQPNKPNHSLVLLLVIMLLPLGLWAQKDYKWDTADSATPIPELFKSADAVMIYNQEIRQTQLEDYRFFSRNILKRKIKIQTQQGLEKYARIVIPIKNGMHISILDARTLKQDGSSVDLDAKNDIKEVELTDEDDLDKTKYKVFSIPGVTVGDEVEIVCIQDGYTVEWGATVVLHELIPVLKTEFKVESKDKGVVILAISRNGMSQGKIEKNLGAVTMSWTGENLPGLYDQRGNISARSLPHFMYELNVDRLYTDAAPPNIKSWSDLLHHYNEQVFEVRIRKPKKFDELFEAIMSTAESTARIHQLTAIQNYLNEVSIESIPESEASEGVEYFLEKKKADYNTLIKMYKSLLDKMDIHYLFAAGRSKYAGPIDLTFPSYLQISNLVFLLPDAMGNSILLPTQSKTNTYGINEVPLDLYDTDIYMINPKDKTVFQTVSLSDQGYKKNLVRRKIKGSVQLDKGLIQYHAEESYLGALSTEFRKEHYEHMKSGKMKDYFDEYLEEQRISSLDTFYLSKAPDRDPFRYQLFYDYQTNHQITKLEDKVISISLNDMLDHYIQRANANRILDYHAPYAYTDEFTYYMEFDQAITLSNKENLQLNVSNDTGSFLFAVSQVNPTTLLINSKYTLTKGVIPVGQINQLIDLMEAAKKADNEGIIVVLE